MRLPNSVSARNEPARPAGGSVDEVSGDIAALIDGYADQNQILSHRLRGFIGFQSVESVKSVAKN
jgi:hypothetical protein